jgi:uroporphyrinogen decarboxylase
MNSRERVKAALKFNHPDKVPIFNSAKGDIVPLPLRYSKQWNPGQSENEIGLFPHFMNPNNWNEPEWTKNRPEFKGGNWKNIPHEEVDEWGCIWDMKGNDKNIGHPGRPSLPDLGNIDEYLEQYTLNAEDLSRYESAFQFKESFSDEFYKLMLIDSRGPCHVVSEMRGFSNFLIDHVKHPTELSRLLKHVTDYIVESIKVAYKFGLNPDGIMFDDDLGEQTGPYFSPRLFKKFYDPHYRKIFDTAHEFGCDVHMHCCGKVDRLLSVLIDCGLDAIEFDSPRMSGYTDLKNYRGKIMFWGCVNIQSIYWRGTPDDVEREVWHMMRNLGTKEGGYGAFFYHEPKVINTPLKNIRAFLKGLKKYGDYSKIPHHWWDYPTVKIWDDFEVPPLPPLDPI